MSNRVDNTVILWKWDILVYRLNSNTNDVQEDTEMHGLSGTLATLNKQTHLTCTTSLSLYTAGSK